MGSQNYRQKFRKTLYGYIRRFSWQCNELPNVIDADIIGAFLSGTTYKSLVHKLGCKGHASGEEAVGAIFDRLKGKTK